VQAPWCSPTSARACHSAAAPWMPPSPSRQFRQGTASSWALLACNCCRPRVRTWELGGLFIAGCTSFNHCHTYLKLPMQWLFRGDHPPAQIHTFFSSLHRCLKPGARAALQVYVEGQSVGSCPTVSSSHPAGCMFRICHIFPARQRSSSGSPAPIRSALQTTARRRSWWRVPGGAGWMLASLSPSPTSPPPKSELHGKPGCTP
jgi:hypothetical protein